jgi:hypothetical protein
MRLVGKRGSDVGHRSWECLFFVEAGNLHHETHSFGYSVVHGSDITRSGACIAA